MSSSGSLSNVLPSISEENACHYAVDWPTGCAFVESRAFEYHKYFPFLRHSFHDELCTEEVLDIKFMICYNNIDEGTKQCSDPIFVENIDDGVSDVCRPYWIQGNVSQVDQL